MTWLLIPISSQREVKNVALVIVTADRGLCGAFNTNIIKEATHYIEDELLPNKIRQTFFALGRRVLNSLLKEISM